MMPVAPVERDGIAADELNLERVDVLRNRRGDDSRGSGERRVMPIDDNSRSNLRYGKATTYLLRQLV